MDLKGLRSSPTRGGAFVQRFVNLDFRAYLKFLNWMPQALKMPEPELIDHAGLDSVVYLRIYWLGLKIFAPIAVLAWAVLVPVNWTNDTLELANQLRNVTSSDIDKLSVSNIPEYSMRFWTHIVMAYAFTIWTCYVLMKEYETIANMRLQFLASEARRPDQSLNVPPDADETVSELVEHFFLVNHPDHYLTHQVVCNANKLADLVEKKKKLQNWLDYYQLKYSRNNTGRIMVKIAKEREEVVNDPKSIMPAAFVSFKTRWAAAVCAQTQQTRNPTQWLTEWAPEPRDVYWPNLAIPYVALTVRRLLMHVAFFFLTFFFIVPIAFVQSLATIEGIVKVAPFLKVIVEDEFMKSVIQGFLPGIALKLFLIFLPSILMIMAKFEGFTSISSLERRSAFRYYIFNFVNVFSRQRVAGEILMLKPLIMFHLKNTFLVKTDKDREEAMDPGSIGFNTGEPRIQLYFLLGLVYAPVHTDASSFHLDLLCPCLHYVSSSSKVSSLATYILTFLQFLVFEGGSCFLSDHNVYNQEYESAAAFWPDVHGRVIAALMISQVLLMGLWGLSTPRLAAPFLIALPVLTIGFHRFCKGRYEPAFVRYPLQEAKMKDTLESAREPNLNLKGYLQSAYVHPVFKGGEDDDDDDDYGDDKLGKFEDEAIIVPTKRQSRRNTPAPSKISGESSPSLPFSGKEV
ncbi:hypothetical protein HID58_057828 [Brassica napus]|uniref:Calcium permeable stress-gated cation channel 1 n=1 Tax=Brassica napus TaxID=3708 RepID=A0ABQ7XFK4_BRANA|nr:hypothetical protein HID58_057828 [Brassica napus]